MNHLEEKAKIEVRIEKNQNGKDCNLTDCEDCGCLIHVSVYELHKKDEICKKRGVCGTCWRGYYDEYIKTSQLTTK